MFSFGQNMLVVTDDQDRLFAAAGQRWQELFPPTGWQQVTVTPDGKTYLYSEATGQIWRSADAGATWSLVGRWPKHLHATRSVLYPSGAPDVMLLVADHGLPFGDVLYRSTDSGMIWSERQLGEAWGALVFSPDFAADSTVFATHSGYHIALGVLKSTDAGQAWAAADNGLPHGVAASQPPLALSPQFPLDQVAFVAGGSLSPVEWGLYRTENAGAVWVKTNDEHLGGPPALSPYYGQERTLLVPDWDHERLFLARDDGRTLSSIWDQPGWSLVAWGITSPHAFTDPGAVIRGPFRLFLPLVSRAASPAVELWLVAREGGSGACYLHRSLDGGQNWQEMRLPE